jgi:serine/threonine protein phosphatase PrpC
VRELIKKILTPKKNSYEPDTIPVLKKSIVGEQPTIPGVQVPRLMEPPQLITACGQSMGQQRDHNEDALFTCTTILVSDTRHIPFGLYIVADGMGGHQHGEEASAIAVRTMAGLVIHKLLIPLLQPQGETPEQSFQEIMHEGILEAHKAIIKQAIGGGTTLTAVLIFGDQMTIAHVGDSRAYLISPSQQVDIITRDHSLVKRLVELGQITPEEAAIHPQRNVLYRALGQGEPIEPDIISSSFPCDSYLLLCSDGLWGVVPQDEIVNLITNTPLLHVACQKLIERANLAGGPDNITAILVRYPS